MRILLGDVAAPIGTPMKMGNLLFVSSAYEGATMMQFDPDTPMAKRLWHRGGRNENTTDAIHMLIPTAALKDGYIYGVEIYGQLRCLNARTGERVWESLALRLHQPAHVVDRRDVSVAIVFSPIRSDACREGFRVTGVVRGPGPTAERLVRFAHRVPLCLAARDLFLPLRSPRTPTPIARNPGESSVEARLVQDEGGWLRLADDRFRRLGATP